MNANKLKTNFGFDPEDIELAKQIQEKWGAKAYYNLGAVMAVLSQEAWEEHGFKYGDDVPFTGWTKCLAEANFGGWIDHLVKLKHPKENDGFHVVSSPYGLEQKDLEQLISFCKEHDLIFKIFGVGRGDAGELYFPGHTIDIHIYKKDDKAGQ